MKNIIRFSFFLALALLTSCQENVSEYAPTIESLQEYETPEWFRDAKFGIWVCWNAYTVPAVGDWYARNMYIEGHPHYKYHSWNSVNHGPKRDIMGEFRDAVMAYEDQGIRMTESPIGVRMASCG